jgi:DNA polymerase-1
MSTVIVDGNYMAIRAMTVNQDMVTQEGINTSGIYIILKMMWVMREKFGKDLVVALDSGHSQFRKSIYPDYKVKNKKPEADKTDAELMEDREWEINKTRTFSLLRNIIPKMGIPVVKMEGEEADDIIYRLCEHIGPTSIAASDDSDYLQMVNLGVKVWQPMKTRLVDQHNFKEIMGFDPAYFTLFKSVIGDGSDNIGGVHGVGEKTCMKIIEKMTAPTIDEMIRVCDEEKGKVFKKVIEQKAIIERNMNLVDLSRMPLSKESVVESYQRSLSEAKIDYNYVQDMFQRLEFKSLANWLLAIKN